jgi:hypothetical protein
VDDSKRAVIKDNTTLIKDHKKIRYKGSHGRDNGHTTVHVDDSKRAVTKGQHCTSEISAPLPSRPAGLGSPFSDLPVPASEILPLPDSAGLLPISPVIQLDPSLTHPTIPDQCVMVSSSNTYT